MQITHRRLSEFVEKHVKMALGHKDPLTTVATMKVEFPDHKRIRPGEYEAGFFVTLFLDIRGSTKRCQTIGAEKTFVTIQALLPALALIVDELDGFVVDYPGDGIMAHWDMAENAPLAIDSAVKAATWMDDAVKTVINPILEKYQIPPVICGIGVCAGKVVICKIGIPGYYSAKAIGDSVNRAAKLSGSELNGGKILIDLDTANVVYRPVSTTSITDAAFNYGSGPDNTIEISRPMNGYSIPRDVPIFLSELLRLNSSTTPR